MTTLDPIDAVLDKLTIESAKELGNGYVVYARGMAYVIDAVRAALSSLPAQAVPQRWRDVGYLMACIDDAIEQGYDPDVDGPLLDEIRAELKAPPSQPAAVGITDEMVEAARQLYSDKVREYDRDFHSEMEALDWQAKYGSHLHSASRGERWAMKQVLEAALRSTP